MSRRASLRIRLAAGAVLAAVFASAMRGQGEGAAAATATAPREGIAEAKKDFDSIKSVRDAALLPNSRMPTVSVPELSLPTAPSAIGTSKAKPDPREAKSANWLVDAMKQSSSTSSSRLQDSRSGNRNSRSPSRDRDVTDEKGDGRNLTESENDAARIEQDRRDQREEDVTAAVAANPLNDFLGTWITPRDYALLKPGLTPNDSGLGAKASALPSSISGTSVAGRLAELTRVGSASAAIAIPPSRENPYLQSLKTELPSAMPPTRRPIDVAPIASPPRPPPVIVPSPVPPSQSKIPEFAKPTTDERYFKQLKRF